MTTPKKALIVANSGGFFSFLLSDIDLLKAHGYEVQAAGNGQNHNWHDTKEELKNRSVPFTHIDFAARNPFAKSNVAAFHQLKQILSAEKFDVIHCHTPIVGILVRLAANKLRKKETKILYTTHGFAFTRYSSWKQWFPYHTIESIGSRLCDAIITINQEDFANAKKMHCRHVFYIPGVGVNLKKYHEVNIDPIEYRKSLGIPEDKIMILSVGEITARKNHRIIVEAIDCLPDKEQYVFVVCGSGKETPEGQALMKRAKDRSVDLRLLGFRWDIPEIMHCSDIGAIPSVREGLGLAGIQSLCAEVPVIGSRVQGICDYIEDGKNGFLCNPFDVDAFAQKIHQLSCSDTREKLARNCFASVQGFDLRISKKRMEEIYGFILEW